jgi:ammonium transporter Rh
LVSVFGYVSVSPLLEQKLTIYDTCGVHNLHGMPSVLGGLASAIFVTLDHQADFLSYGKGVQGGRQVLAVVASLLFAVVTGFFTGLVMVKVVAMTPTAEYDDAVWWQSGYMEEAAIFEEDVSGRPKARIAPCTDDAPETQV